MKNEQQRLAAANEFIKSIAGCGRNFFSENSDLRNKVENPFVSTLEIDNRGRVWFIDYYTKKRIYTHYSGRWNGFTSGGTLRDIIISLRNYVKLGSKLRANYFNPDWGHGFGNPWGYGDEILKVKEAAIRLDIAV